MKRYYVVETPYGTEGKFEYEVEAIEFIIKSNLVGVARIVVRY